MKKTPRISRAMPGVAVLFSLAVVAVSMNDAAAQWSPRRSSPSGFSSNRGMSISPMPGRPHGGGMRPWNPERPYRPPAPSTLENNKPTPQWGSLIRGLDAFNRSMQSQNRQRQQTFRPQYTPQPSYRPQYYPSTSVAPRNTVQPVQPVQTTSAVPPKNTLPTSASRPTVNRASAPSNKQRYARYLNSAAQQAVDDSVQQADELASTAESQLLNDPALSGMINGGQDVRNALEQYEQTGDPSALEAIRNHPNTPDRIKEKIGLVIQSNELRDEIRDGLTTLGTDRKYQRLRDRIINSNTLTPAEKRAYRDSLAGLKASNERRKLIELLEEGGLAGGSGGGIVSIPPDVIVPGDTLFIEPPVSDSEAALVTSGVVLHNPASNGGAIAYLLGSQTFTLEPGQTQRLDRSHVIEFDRGGSFGMARYTIADGSFEFTLTDNGWNLRKKTYELTIDNSRFPADFGYLVDGQAYTVRRGEERRHSSAYPMLVEFDRGDGGEPARKQLLGGTYTVGVDANQGRLDLFEGGATLRSPRVADY